MIEGLNSKVDLISPANPSELYLDQFRLIIFDRSADREKGVGVELRGAQIWWRVCESSIFSVYVAGSLSDGLSI